MNTLKEFSAWVWDTVVIYKKVFMNIVIKIHQPGKLQGSNFTSHAFAGKKKSLFFAISNPQIQFSLLPPEASSTNNNTGSYIILWNASWYLQYSHCIEVYIPKISVG